MMTYFSDNLDRDIDNYMDEYDYQVRSAPKCSECGEPIMDDFCYRIGENIYCEDCIESFKTYVEVLDDYE